MISVVVPTYNSGKNIIDAIRSCLMQNVELEIIIVDDGSVDLSEQNLISWLVDNTKFEKIYTNSSLKSSALLWKSKIYGLNNNLIRQRGSDIDKEINISIYKNINNLGVAASRNIAVDVAKGDYIAFLDSDDWWDNTKLEKQLNLIKDSDAVLCNTSRELMKASGISTGKIIETPEVIDLKQLKHSNYINCSSVLIRTDIMRKHPMQHSDAQEDYLTWLNVLGNEGNAVGINEPLMKYRLSVGGKSRNKFKSAIMTFKTYRYAGYGILKSITMMIPYAYNGVKKYR